MMIDRLDTHKKVSDHPATIDNLPACQIVLSRLHGCDYPPNGGLERFNFRIQEISGAAVITSFAGCKNLDDAHAFRAKMDDVEV